MKNNRKQILISAKNHLKSMKKDQLLILILSGILLLVITLPTGEKQDDSKETEKSTDLYGEDGFTYDQSSYVDYLERHLEEVLSQMEGAGDVTVMITLRSSAEKIIEKDLETQNESITENDSQGGSRITQNDSLRETTVYDGEDDQIPYICKIITPSIEGVVVLAAGGDNAVVKEQITEAVQALFGVDTHKIRIMKKNES